MAKKSDKESRTSPAAKAEKKKSSEVEVKHDPLCVNSNGSCCSWLEYTCNCQCMCDFINEVREDQKRIDANVL